MKTLFFLLAGFFAVSTAKAQVSEEDIRNLPSKEEVLKKISDESGVANVQPASADSERPDEAGKRALPHWDYAYTQGGCYYIAHAYQHSIFGIGYGAVYYEDELVDCPPHVHTPPYP